MVVIMFKMTDIINNSFGKRSQRRKWRCDRQNSTRRSLTLSMGQWHIIKDDPMKRSRQSLIDNKTNMKCALSDIRIWSPSRFTKCNLKLLRNLWNTNSRRHFRWTSSYLSLSWHKQTRQPKDCFLDFETFQHF